MKEYVQFHIKFKENNCNTLGCLVVVGLSFVQVGAALKQKTFHSGL